MAYTLIWSDNTQENVRDVISLNKTQANECQTYSLFYETPTNTTVIPVYKLDELRTG